LPESRTGRRFRLELPIKIEAADGRKQGITRDVSSSGVFIEASPSLKIGARVRFNIMLPRELLATPKDVQVACLGRVVRVESAARGKKGRSGVACVIDSYKFMRKAN
jgi:hypothetical protein